MNLEFFITVGLHSASQEGTGAVGVACRDLTRLLCGPQASQEGTGAVGVACRDLMRRLCYDLGSKNKASQVWFEQLKKIQMALKKN